jgi:SAM-dependent methyltransferase
MLVFETPFHRWFAERYAEQIHRLAEYEMPNFPPQPGERSVQDTFTDQWDKVQDDELSFLYSEEDLKELNHKVWLKWLEGSRDEVRSILDIGCGLGRESLVLQEVADGAEVFGIDLNFGLLQSGEVYKTRLGIHFVIASLFHLPFRWSSFDLVYSQGVIMMSFSTVEAFRSIASYVRSGGYLFIWVYGLDDHLIRRGAKGILTRINYAAEGVVRPLISRSPKVLRDTFFNTASVVLHPLTKMRVRHKEMWKLENTNHNLRDLLSHRYARRHSYNEVLEWFENLGFKVIDIQSPAAYRRLFKKQLWGVGITGKKV